MSGCRAPISTGNSLQTSIFQAICMFSGEYLNSTWYIAAYCRSYCHCLLHMIMCTFALHIPKTNTHTHTHTNLKNKSDLYLFSHTKTKALISISKLMMSQSQHSWKVEGGPSFGQTKHQALHATWRLGMYPQRCPRHPKSSSHTRVFLSIQRRATFDLMLSKDIIQKDTGSLNRCSPALALNISSQKPRNSKHLGKVYNGSSLNPGSQWVHPPKQTWFTWKWGPLGSSEIPSGNHHFQVPFVNFWGCKYASPFLVRAQAMKLQKSTLKVLWQHTQGIQ